MNNGKIPVIGSNGIIGYHDTYSTLSPCITIGRSGNIGLPLYFEENCWAHNTTLYVEDFKKNYPKYLYYLLKTIDFKNYGGGSAVPTLNRNHIHPIIVKYFEEFKTQKKIADILSNFDYKIELNNQINANLEQQAQAIFKSWFVDFEPFKDGEFVESELGLIPKGWLIGKFTDVINVLGGGTPNTTNPEFWGGSIPFFTPKDVNGSGFVLATEKNITELGLKKCNSPLFPKYTVFVTARGTVGKIVISGKEMAMNQSCYALIGKKDYGQGYVYFAATHAIQSLKNKANGAVFDALITRDFDNEHVIVPPLNIIFNFEKIIIPILNNILCLSDQNIMLGNMRNLILPKLMNGEFDL